MATAPRSARGGMTFDDLDADRDPFGAYVTDDATAAIVASAAEAKGWPAAAVRKGSLETALRVLGVARPPRYMVLDVEGLAIEDIEPGLTELARLGAIVVVLGTINDVAFFRRIMRAGARDYLTKPLDAEGFTDVVLRLDKPMDDAVAKGRLIGFLGTRGGVGATTLSINAGFLLAERLKRRTALVDLDIYTGNIALALEMESTHGLREAFDDPERVDEVFLQNAMTKIGTYLHVLATEEKFDDAVRMSDEKLLMLSDILRSNFDIAVLDIPRHFVMREPALFTKLDDLVLVAELTLQSARDTNRLMKLIAGRNRQLKMHVVVNQVPGKPEVTLEEFATAIDTKPEASFGQDPKSFNGAAFKGKPLVVQNPKHRIVADLHRFCLSVTGVREAAKPGFFKRLVGKS